MVDCQVGVDRRRFDQRKGTHAPSRIRDRHADRGSSRVVTTARRAPKNVAGWVATQFSIEVKSPSQIPTAPLTADELMSLFVALADRPMSAGSPLPS